MFPTPEWIVQDMPHNKLYWDPVGHWEPTFLQHRGYRGTQVGVGNLDFCNIVGPKWESGI
jgi:hypothetical protein